MRQLNGAEAADGSYEIVSPRSETGQHAAPPHFDGTCAPTKMTTLVEMAARSSTCRGHERKDMTGEVELSGEVGRNVLDPSAPAPKQNGPGCYVVASKDERSALDPHPSPTKSRYAYASSLWGASPGFALGALVLGRALRRSGATHDLVLLHTGDVPKSTRAMLSKVRALKQVD